MNARGLMAIGILAAWGAGIAAFVQRDATGMFHFVDTCVYWTSIAPFSNSLPMPPASMMTPSHAGPAPIVSLPSPPSSVSVPPPPHR